MTMKQSSDYIRIVAIDPCTKGFGFAVLEGGACLVDWGVARVWSKNDDEFLARVESLVDRYKPAGIVVEEPEGNRRRSTRSSRRIRLVVEYARARKLRLYVVSDEAVRHAFREAGGTKHERATAIAEQFPELKPHLPPRRKPWMSEDERMNIFDALMLALGVSVAG